MISEKWQHSINRYLDLPLDSDFFDFYIQPGVCKEVIGKDDKFYSNSICVGSDKVYCWSEFHHKKIKSFYSCCPFLFDLARVSLTKKFNPKGSLFFLPRGDRVVKRNNDMSWKNVLHSVPKPITILAPYRIEDKWDYDEDIKVTSLSNPETRQIQLSKLLLSHEFVYLHLPSSDTFYANFLDKKVIHYDDIKNYSSKKISEIIAPSIHLRHLNWSYEKLNETQKLFFDFDFSQEDIRFLTNKMLGLEVLLSPNQLAESLSINTTIKNSFSYDCYQWIKEKSKNFVNSNCSNEFSVVYNNF